MKQLRLFKMMLLMCLLVIAGNAWGEVVTDVITADILSANGTEYADFSDIIIQSGAVYAGNSAKSPRSTIQLRSKNSNSGIVSTTSGGKLKSVKITIETGTNVLRVYGKNTAYNKVTELYGSREDVKGTEIGSLSQTGTIEITGAEYDYVGIRAYDGVVYISSIEIEWEKDETLAQSHTAHFSVDGHLDSAYDCTVEEGTAITFPDDPADIDNYTFVGWTKTESYDNATTAPGDLCKSAKMGKSDVTYYAVFANVSGSTPIEKLSQTLKYDTWTYWGDTTDKTSYRLFHSGSFIESSPFDLSKLSKVIVYGGTFGGDSYNSLTIGDGTNVWKNVTVSGNSATGENIYTDGSPLSGTKELRVICNSGKASGTGVRISKVEIYTNEIEYIYSNYTTLVTKVELSSIYISGTPTNLIYDEGQIFNPEGLVVTGVYSNNTSMPITEGITWTVTPDILSVGTTSVQVVASIDDIVSEAYEVSGITVNELPALTTMDAIFAKALEDGGKSKYARIAFNNWVISGLNGTKNAYLTDNQGKGLIIFDNNASHGFEVGDVLSGTVACKVQMYNGSAELTALSSASDGLSIAKNGNVVEQNINISSLEGINTGALLSYEGLTYHLNGTNAEFTDGENVITAYKGIIGTLPELVEGKTYNVKGIFLMYGTKKEILPRTVEDIVLVEVINNYIVTYGTTENGTIVVKNGETVINSGDEVAEGTKLTIECTPTNDDYRFKSWEYKEDGGEWITNATSFDFTMPSVNVQFRATFELIPLYTITWSENGNVTTQSYKEGAKLVPPTVEEIYGKVFTGWVTSESVDASTEPDYVKPSNATAPTTYYAVYATKRGEDVLREFTFTIDTDDFSGASYAENNGSHTVKARADDGATLSVNYISESVMLSNGTIQFKGNAGYLYNTTDLGSIKSITLADRSVNLAVYYGDTEHPTEGTEATGGYFTVSSNAKNVGSSNSITVVFEKATGATYSHFTTRVRTLDISETDKPIQGEGYYDGVKVARTINANGWSVLCLPFDMSADQIAASFHDVNVEVRRMTGLRIVGNTYKIIFSPVTSMKKGIPYIISLSGKKEGFIANDVIVDCAGDLVDRVNAGDEEVIFHGTYEDTFSPIGEEYKIFVNNELRTVINQIRVKCTGGYLEMPSTPEDFAITLADVPTYTINWKVNGKYEAPVTLIEGSDLEAPSVDDIYGKVCTGWVTTPTVDADIEPDYVDFGTTKATDKFTFYAVFATMSGESTEIVQELTEEEIVDLGQLAYTTNKTYKDNDIDYTIHAYKDLASRKWLQLKKDQGSYVNIKAPSAIKKVSLIITSASNSSGGVNDITKHTAFDGTVALTTSDCTYSATSQSVASTNSISDNVATLVPTGDNNELYLKVSSGARIWGITVTYGESVSYSKFTTLVKVLLLDENVAAIPEAMEICDPFDAVIINRSIKKDTWSTLCLPFAMNENQITETFGEKADVRKLTGLEVNGNSYTMKFSPVTSIVEGTPYMIRLEEPLNNILVKDVDVYYYDDDYCVDARSDDNNNCVRYHGSYIKQTIEQSPCNYIISGNKFYFVNSDVTNKGFRGWFEILSDDASAASLSASFDDETNGITSINSNVNGNDNLYNVAGQRVSNAHKGVFIKNGKKYLVK